MVKILLKKITLFISKQYTSIGGQAVIEGVMMRSPNSFVVAVRKPDGTIRLRRDQWYGLAQKFPLFKKPFFRGVLVLIEAMMNGIVSLNYSANISMTDEMIEKAKEKGEDIEKLKEKLKKKEQINIGTLFTILTSFLFGIAFFVFLPHAITAWLSETFNFAWDLDSFEFHFVDGLIKAFLFVSYIFIIGFLPDIKRVFQYHGAEHKSISTFEAGEKLIVENAKKYTTLHPRCGTSFIFFLLTVSILLFSAIFTLIPIDKDLPLIARHAVAILFKIALMFPIAGISYEVIKMAGKHPNNIFFKIISWPGLMLQKLTTKEPDGEQLEVALASIKAALFLEKKYELDKADEKKLNLEEVDISSIEEIEETNATLKEFLE